MTGHQIGLIYGLRDPHDGVIRYIGKTIQPLPKRLQQHIWPARTGRHGHAKARWIRGLLESGRTPEIVLLCEVNVCELSNAERLWVSSLESQGVALTNTAPPGGGSSRSYTGKVNSEFVSLLGKLPDEELGRCVGMTRKAVAHHRTRRGIAPCGNRPEAMKKPPPMGGHNKLEIPDAIIAMLGTRPDYELAVQMGATKGVISNERRRRGIEAFANTTGSNGRFKKGNYPARWLTVQ